MLLRPRLLATVAFLGISALALAGCSKKAPEGGARASLSCFIADQHRCEEAPAPDKTQEEARTIECSSVSGKLARPASCPADGFLGKCTTTDNGIVAVHRWYTGADAAYQKAFCADPAKGVWSTAF
jgi:hypothetical protein